MQDVSDLPEIGDPFDVAAAQRPLIVAEADNAFVLYEAAEAKPGIPPVQLQQAELNALLWARMGPEVRSFVDLSRQVLDLWRRGTNRPDALYCQPGTAAFMTSRRPVWDLWSLCKMALLEGDRLEAAGKPTEAWPWHLGVLRCSRHCGKHGWIMERSLGAHLHEEVSHRIVKWAADARVNVSLLRQELVQTQAADALTESLSEMLRYSYLLYHRDFVENSFLHSRMLWEGDGELAREHRRRAALIVRLAAELFRGEHGPDPDQAGDLLGHCLASLPEATKPDDPIPSRLD
jgi:hypothetical protein